MQHVRSRAICQAYPSIAKQHLQQAFAVAWHAAFAPRYEECKALVQDALEGLPKVQRVLCKF